MGAGSRSTRARVVVATAFCAIALVMAWGHMARTPAPRSVTQTYATRAGEIRQVVLAEGTVVTLAPRTRMTVDRDPSTGGRTVSLDGEARFNVVASAKIPFVVRAGGTTTHVLGTLFDVRHYSDDSATRVVVLSGKVATRRHSVPVTLSAGMVGEFADSAVAMSVAADPSMFAGWADGQLVFRRMPVPLALATLHRWYGYEFRLADTSLADGRLTAVFPAGEPDQMMQRLKSLLNVRLTFKDSVITLHPNRDPGRASDGVLDTQRNAFHSPAEVGR